jgi:hypothetical protein
MEPPPYGRIPTKQPRKRRSWQYATAMLAITVIVLVVLFVAPLGSEKVTAIDWHVVVSSSRLYFFNSGAFMPSQSHCVGSTSYVCSGLRVAFNWSASDGQVMSFAFQGDEPPYVTIYNSTNQSWGGYSFVCGNPPRYCGDPFNIITNDTTGYSWAFDWQIIYNYTTPAPLL